MIGTFEGTANSRNVEDYIAADTYHISTTPMRIRRAIAERITLMSDEFPEQSQLVRAQASRQRGFMPIRDLFESAPDVLAAIKPCWVMSPLVVSRLLPMRKCFDIAIFDEASQVTPQDAAGVIARAERVIVAGDPKQLPPTSFFSISGGGIDDEEAESESDQSLVTDIESVLDQMLALLPPPYGTRNLAWHYRSQDERLIAFSNAQESLYNYGMTTFPGVGIDEPIQHIHVQGRSGYGAGDNSSAADEVKQVIDLVSEHARVRPNESLGIITMGIKHANRIEELLRKARKDDDMLEEYLTRHQSTLRKKPEPLFVKNLERVQGDERDAIILTIGYSKTAEGRMQYRFGPLNNSGGERRLNVAITRARRRMIVVSSFRSSDLEPSRLQSEGAQMLGRYLKYAESGGTSFGDLAIAKPVLNPFERDILDRLSSAGIPLIPQWGSSGYWIDFVAQHPTQPGRMVLAIECDGATYHSSKTARDRDRLRQEHLERLGWVFHRIWSTEWFRHRDAEVDRAVKAYHAAVAGSESASTENSSSLQTAPQQMVTPVELVRRERVRPMPVTPDLGSISAYSTQDLIDLVRWINSDSLLRTREEVRDEAIKLLGFKRRRTRFRSVRLTGRPGRCRGST